MAGGELTLSKDEEVNIVLSLELGKLLEGEDAVGGGHCPEVLKGSWWQGQCETRWES